MSSVQHLYGTPAPQPQPQTQTQSGDSSNKEAPEKLHLTSHNQYKTPRLLRSDLSPNPLIQFNKWLSSALDSKDGSPLVVEPEAMTLSTCTKQGIPSSRVVLLKTVDEKGFVFFTNYTSRKSGELNENPYASLTFYWREISRSVRVVGKVEKVSRKESEEYFASRPRGSQIGAWSSPQSKVVKEGEVQEIVDRKQEELGEGKVECPDFWGGWRVIPFEVEFWSGQPSRLHDRFRYTREEGSTGEWEIDRLAP
ncbi:pyridoxamine 5'-phosphate oxidase [Kwoniella dejecticola CBS 10117]|uniref:pyridoxal 5'-phosphate synthase n=1 Tax=Kwoniella dejecticola CBS 10117 TaxID=1296121 RepID=A0A1A6A8Q5_9TREE|nr:pyridoxamine 5'-phosphate oxidase [Kwoniella dejecticola CBS 10117]OBR86441.1 pyridoxamine 5'-phosphate oxidase [Kwoniella dejecticola CBS 10117]